MNWRRPLSSLDTRRWRQRSAAALSLASGLLLATDGAIGAAATQTDASEQRQKLQERRDVNADAQRNASELRGRMDELQAEAIDRGLLLTLGDAAFTTNDADLSSSGQGRLDALADFLKQHPKHSVAIDSYAGAADYRSDEVLSKRRADAVKAYLIRQEIAPSRLTARSSGEPPRDPEDSANEQQTIRRVEVIVEDPLSSVPQSDATPPRPGNIITGALMRHTIVKSRWHTSRRPYSGDWRHNPWIKAEDNSSPARIEVADDIPQDRQQKAAVRIWEDEGGSIRTDGNVRR